MRITKIRYNGERTEIQYELPGVVEGEWDHYQSDCSEQPRPELNTQLQCLRDYVQEVCEFPKAALDSIKVIGVSYSYKGEEETMGAVITATKKVKNASGPMLINTPHVPSVAYDKARMGPSLPEEVVEILLLLQKEAQAYLNGERAQVKLFANEKGNSPAGAADKILPLAGKRK